MRYKFHIYYKITFTFTLLLLFYISLILYNIYLMGYNMTLLKKKLITSL